MPFGKEVGLGPGHIVLDGDPVGTQPPQQPLPISDHAYCGQTVAHLSNCWALVDLFFVSCCIWFPPIAWLQGGRKKSSGDTFRRFEKAHKWCGRWTHRTIDLRFAISSYCKNPGIVSLQLLRTLIRIYHVASSLSSSYVLDRRVQVTRWRALISFHCIEFSV